MVSQVVGFGVARWVGVDILSRSPFPPDRGGVDAPIQRGVPKAMGLTVLRRRPRGEE